LAVPISFHFVFGLLQIDRRFEVTDSILSFLV